FKLELPPALKRRGLHPSFHASLLRIHVPNDDRRFPGRQITHFFDFGDKAAEWDVDCILDHSGRGAHTLFKIKWKSGDVAWLSYHEVKHLRAYEQYLEAQGASSLSAL
ncbi:hypothetical protein BD410DRAFT_693365, partial [Rickenella mellea]